MKMKCPNCDAKYTIPVYDRMVEKRLKCWCGVSPEEFEIEEMRLEPIERVILNYE